MSALTDLHDAVAAHWPQHRRVMERNLAACSAPAQALADETAQLIVRIMAGDLERLVKGYVWMCQMIAEEELFFRREGRYRNTSFAQVNAEVYSRPDVMGPYMDGLLASQVLWSNHIQVLDFYVGKFLPAAKPQESHLEIGPGHGLLLYFAARAGRPVNAWDVSANSLEHSAACLSRLGITSGITFGQHDIFGPLPRETFDNIVMSEVLEHLERPGDALAVVRQLLSPGGRALLNVPVNSPTVDHLALFRTPEEIADLATRHGFQVDDMLVAPAAGYSEEKARRIEGGMSCCLIVRPVD